MAVETLPGRATERRAEGPDGRTSEPPAAAPNPLDARYRDETCRVLMTGIQALARVPLERARIDRAAGMRTAAFVSGYEGSPLGGYDLELGRQRALLDEHDVRFEPGLNEELAATAVQGTQLIHELQPTVEGVTGYWYGKAPGLDRAKDAFRHASLMGTHPSGGAVAFVGDDPSAKSSTVPCASEHALADLVMPIFYPSDPAEILEYGRHAIAMSRASGLWSSMKIVTAVADGSTTVDLQAGETFEPVLPFGAGKHVPTGKLLQPTLGPLERDQFSTRVRIAREYAVLNGLNRVVRRSECDRIGVLTAGTDYLDTMQALATLGFGDANGAGAENESTVRVMKLGVVWPLDRQQLTEFFEGLDTVIVVEEKRAFIETQVKELLYDAEHRPTVLGKRDAEGRELFPEHGELSADIVTKGLASVLSALPDAPGVERWLEARRSAPRERKLLPLAARTPYFCSGCPHNTSTKPLSDSAFGAGIGCHAMVLLMDPKQVGDVIGLTQMGGEGTQWIGMAPFVENGHFVQNLGDGTYHHSGSLAVRASVAANTNITYRILYNSTVAMTGGQDAVGQMTIPEIVSELLAEGVARIIITSDDLAALKKQRVPSQVDIWHRDRIDEAHRVLAETPGTTVLIHEQECATELRRKRKRGLAKKPEEFVMINERICEGCGDCGEKSNCLSVQPVDTEFGRKTHIHQSSCNVDKSCLKGDCPAFVTVRPGKKQARGSGVPSLEPTDLPEPPAVASRSHRVRLMGIGGTGIVTTSQLLATAAVLSGRFVRTLDRTGLAQKGGAVVSDIAIEPEPFEESNSITTGGCDLYLGYDLLVAADGTNLSVISPDANAIVSTSPVPTGTMVSDVRVGMPDAGEGIARVADALVGGSLIDLDLRYYAEGLFGSEQMGNMFLLGIAVQQGMLSLRPEAIEEAISLNGVAVSANTQAFRRGRQFVADRKALDAAVRERAGQQEPEVHYDSELDRLVAIREAELVSYQDQRYARRYIELVDLARSAEIEVLGEGARLPGAALPFAEAVAKHLFKLMAYKDEYEVARLALRPEMRDEIEREFGEGAKVQWRLHPPTLKAMGLKRKIKLGAWFRPAFVALRAARRLRGTALDPFGRDRIRKLERELLAEYEAIVRKLAAELTPESHATAVEIAGLPDMVRGYEDVKLASVERYRERLAALMQ